jgi:RecB family endonuclease NucS
MTIFEFGKDKIIELKDVSFSEKGIKERTDLQRLLRAKIEIVAPESMIISEEFGDWDDSKRRIDLLALDKDANLVVIELKRTEDGGHMELQAIRYAAMVSTMTFENAVETYAAFLKNLHSDQDAREAILDFLEWTEPDENNFAKDVRIILVSEDFSKEITTAVMWLNERMLNIRCVRLKPYEFEGRLLVDVHQIIPLPEAEEYIIKVSKKENVKRASQWNQKDLPTIWKDIEENCNEDEKRIAREISDWLQPLVTEVFPTANGFAPLVGGKDRNRFLFKVMTNGKLQIWFHYLSKKPPFADEAMRKELLARLNKIEGVGISEDKISGKPSFDLLVLKSKFTMDLFKECFEWAIEEIKNYH